MISNFTGGGAKEEQTITSSVEAAGNATMFKLAVSKGYQAKEKTYLNGILYHGTVTATGSNSYLDIDLGTGAEQAAPLIASALNLLVQAIYTGGGSVFLPAGLNDSSILSVVYQRPSNGVRLLITSKEYLAGVALATGAGGIGPSGSTTLRLSVPGYYFIANETYTVDIFTGPV